MVSVSTTFHFWWELGTGQPAPTPGIPSFDILWPDGGTGFGIYWPSFFGSLDWPGI